MRCSQARTRFTCCSSPLCEAQASAISALPSLKASAAPRSTSPRASIGVEGVSKPMNLGSLLRSAHAFGASFAFTIAASFDAKAASQSDTSAAVASLPFHAYGSLAELKLPHRCRLVGIEFRDDAVDLP